ncbi:peroxin-14 [Cryptococcus neoformans Ze90-1]|nr:peroxin-14 [Cryptococcus neoformans var. grubii Ze90-1]
MPDSTPPDRVQLIQNAILFLNDPKTQNSSLTSRVQFLESKGLTEKEIEQAIREAGDAGTAGVVGEGEVERERVGPSSAYGRPPERPRVPAPNYGYGYTYAPPEPPKRDWRDLFIMAMVSGGVVYGLTALTRKYLLPHLRPPSTTAFQSTSSELTSKYDEAARLLHELTEETNKVQMSIEEDREKVNQVVEEVEIAVKGLKAGEERWRDEMRDMRGEVESLKELVPRMIEKHMQSQSSALADLQSEIRSLKTLLASRSQLPATGSVAGSGSESRSGAGSPAPTPTAAAANALLGPRAGGKAGIPAWQMAPPPPPTSTTHTSSNSTSTNGSGSGEDTSEMDKGKGKEE